MISEQVLCVLRNASVEGSNIRLNSPQLDRKLYLQVNEVLERLGGKWNRKLRAHTFEFDPGELLEQVLLTGDMPRKNPLAFFRTPPAPADRTARRARLDLLAPGDALLEPSAGDGALLDAAMPYLVPGVDVDAVELDPGRAQKLRDKGYKVHEQDFLSFVPRPPNRKYHAIIMNPPFAVEADPDAYITHIEYAWSLLADGGILVAIAPPGFVFNSKSRCKQFKAFVEEFGGWEELDDKSFHESGTDVRTVLICLEKPFTEEEWDEDEFAIEVFAEVESFLVKTIQSIRSLTKV